MFEERYRKLPNINLNLQAYPIERKISLPIRALSSLQLNEVLGYSCITGDFYKLHNQLIELLGSEQYKHFIKYRDCEYNDYKLHMADADDVFIKISKGKQYGYIYCEDAEDISSDILAEEASQIMSQIPWQNDGVMKSISKLAEDCLRNTAYPRISMREIELIHLERAFNCYKGGILAAYKLGTFHNVYAYDFNMAYLSAMSDLLTINPPYMQWVDSKIMPNNAVYGFCLAEVDLHIPLVAVRMAPEDKDEALFLPIGRFIVWLTLDEVQLVKDSGGSVTILEGSWGVPTDSSLNMFDKTIVLLTKAIDNPITYPIAKPISSIIWGKLGSSTSVLLNFPYVATILAKNRTKLMRLSLKATNTLSLSIDGLEHEGPILGVKEGKGINTLKYKVHSTMIVCNDQYKKTEEEVPWVLKEDGVQVNAGKITPQMLIAFDMPTEKLGEILQPSITPYGSTKMKGPSNLTLTKLRKQYVLKPLTIEECMMRTVEEVDLFVDKRVEATWAYSDTKKQVAND